MTFYCHSDCSTAESAICKWEKSHIKLGVVPDDWPVQGQALIDFIKSSVAHWERHCGITFEIVEVSNAHDVNMPVLRIDGPGGVLAWSELPCGEDRRLQQRYDIRENWGVEWNETGGKVSLAKTVCHEIGHAIGIPHGPKGNVMYYSSGGWTGPTLGPWDIQEARRRYPAAPTPPPEEPPMQNFWPCIVKGIIVVIECLSQKQAEAEAAQQRGPLDELADFLMERFSAKK